MKNRVRTRVVCFLALAAIGLLACSVSFSSGKKRYAAGDRRAREPRRPLFSMTQNASLNRGDSARVRKVQRDRRAH